MSPFVKTIALITLFARGFAADVPDRCYLFSYFTGNGESGLHLAWSSDGLEWKAIGNGKSFLTPATGGRLMRDPCVTTGPDGLFHMVWTDSWKGGTIGYASSRDLITWSAQKSLAVMKEYPAALNCWAPEIIHDSRAGNFLIFWASTVPGKFHETEFGGKNDSNHRIYATTTEDFETFTSTRLFFDPGFNAIDSTLLRLEDGGVIMFFKDETKHPAPMKNLRLASAASPAGPFQLIERPVTRPGLWVEGPSALKVGEEVMLYFDAYTRHHYAGLKSRDLKEWTDITGSLSMPEGIRHGTAFEVSGSVVRKLLDH